MFQMRAVTTALFGEALIAVFSDSFELNFLKRNEKDHLSTTFHKNLSEKSVSHETFFKGICVLSSYRHLNCSQATFR